MNTLPRPVSVLDPVSLAIERVKEILFRPFDPIRWLTIGFCAWLATLGENMGGGGGGGGNNNGNGAGPQSFNDFWNEGMEYVTANLSWIVLAAAGVILFVIALGLLITWLNSRGQFMFLHNVATGRAEVVAPWNTFASHANSLFLFRVILGLGMFALSLPFLSAGLWSLFSMLRREEIAAVPMILAVVGLGLTLLLGLIYGVIAKLTTDFVVPIMALRGSPCRVAWIEFAGLLRAHAGTFLLYLIFSIVLGVAVAVAILLGAIICCIACCFLAIPYIGTVLLLPVYVFLRSYSAFFFAQFGPTYDVFNRG